MKRLLQSVAAAMLMGGGGSPPSPLQYIGTTTSTVNGTTHTFTNVNIGSADADRVVIVGINWAANIDLDGVTFEGNAAFLNTVFQAPVGQSFLSAMAVLPVPTGTDMDVVATFGSSAVTCVIHVWTVVLSDLGFIDFGWTWEDSTTSSTLALDIRPDGWAVGCTAAGNDQTSAWSGSDAITVRHDSLVEALYTQADEIDTTQDLYSAIYTGSGTSGDRSLAMTSFAPLDPGDLVHVLGQYVDIVNRTTYSFVSALGVPHVDRDIIFAFAWQSSAGRNVSSVTIGGVSATQIAHSTLTAGGCAIYRAAVPSGFFGDIVVVMDDQATKMVGKVLQMNPTTVTPIDSDTGTATATSITLSNLAITNGGFALFVTRSGLTELPAPTWSGSDAVETLVSRVDEANSYLSVYLVRSTETDITRDFTITTTSSGTKNIVGASWL